MARVHELIVELAEFERLRHQVVGTIDDLIRDLNEAFQCRVLEIDGEIVGYTLYFFNYSTFRCRRGLYLEDLYVQPPFRGQGYGKLLLLDLKSQAKELNCGRFEWSVLDWNETAIDFYKALGAEVMQDWRICRISLP